ncbi:DNA primase [Massilia sp. TN1-12]|uniref:DNA primase n=1 Tax=Massilia paldalensis TaxID=3377675 RepID=UPI00384C4D7A
MSHRAAHSRDEELQEAIDAIDIESWLDAEGVRYRHTRGARGAQLNVKECPCCGNSSYKVYLNAETGLGNCFHGDCETKFNKWKFISSHLGLAARDVIEHIKSYAREQGWRPPRKRAIAVSNRGELVLPESIPMPHGGRNLKYLDNRNINGDIAAYFELRYSHRGHFDYVNEEGHPMRQDYSSRIIIPIYDLEGELVSFQGRDITGDADKKYLFPPGFSSTGSHLYNCYNAIGVEHVVVGEGVFDVAGIKVAFDQEVTLRDIVPIGSFGKHLSHGDADSQLTKLTLLKEKGLRIVTFMWDGERQAIRDAVKAAQMVASVGISARVALLPKGKDPNEASPEEVRNAFWKAAPINNASATKLLLVAERDYA